MGKLHETLPGEPQEASIRPEQPEIKQPGAPQEPEIPQEAPDRQPEEMPDHAERTETQAMPDVVAAELRNYIEH